MTPYDRELVPKLEDRYGDLWRESRSDFYRTLCLRLRGWYLPKVRRYDAQPWEMAPLLYNASGLR